ncbi:MAG: hypothetical protein WCJ29_01365 [bacterium]
MITSTSDPNLPSNTPPTIPLTEAALKSLAIEVTAIRVDIKEQQGENRNVVYAVLFAAFLILVTVAVEVIFFHTRSTNEVNDTWSKYFEEMTQVRKSQAETELRLQQQIDGLKPYRRTR